MLAIFLMAVADTKKAVANDSSTLVSWVAAISGILGAVIGSATSSFIQKQIVKQQNKAYLIENRKRIYQEVLLVVHKGKNFLLLKDALSYEELHKKLDKVDRLLQLNKREKNVEVYKSRLEIVDLELSFVNEQKKLKADIIDATSQILAEAKKYAYESNLEWTIYSSKRTRTLFYSYLFLFISQLGKKLKADVSDEEQNEKILLAANLLIETLRKELGVLD